MHSLTSGLGMLSQEICPFLFSCLKKLQHDPPHAGKNAASVPYIPLIIPLIWHVQPQPQDH